MAEQFNDKGFGQAFRGQGQSPGYGFTNTPRPEWTGYLDNVLKALGDERVAALLAPGMGLVRAPGMISQAMRGAGDVLSGERGSFNPLGWFQRPGANVPDDISRMVKDRIGMFEGGHVPFAGPEHFSPVTQRLSHDPISWAKLLDKRWLKYNELMHEGISEGLSPSQAEAALRRLNLHPPGLKETDELRLFRRSPANDN